MRKMYNLMKRPLPFKIFKGNTFYFKLFCESTLNFILICNAFKVRFKKNFDLVGRRKQSGVNGISQCDSGGN